MATRNKRPKYLRQKLKGRYDLAYVRINGKRISLGRYDSPQSYDEYDEIIRQYKAGDYDDPSDTSDGITIVELLAVYVEHLESLHTTLNPEPDIGKQVEPITAAQRQAMKPLREFHADVEVKDFGPKKLKQVRDIWIERGLARKTCNAYVVNIKQIFRWGVAEELVPETVYRALQTVAGLKRGKTIAKESTPVRPVPEADIDAIKPYVSHQIWSLIQLQLLTAARPGELLGLRAIDIDTKGEVWETRPEAHKTAHHHHKRHIFFGKKAQRIIKEFRFIQPVGEVMKMRPKDVPLFSPIEAEAERRAKGLPQMKGRKKASRRRPNQKPNPKQTERVIRDAYDIGSYRQAIQRACREAGVPEWAPNRLRHNAATNIRRDYGIEAAQTILGHAMGSAVVEIYAEANLAKSREIISKIG